MARQSSSNAGRAAELLILLSQVGAKGMTLGAMAEACGEARSSVHRTLTALSDHGLVVQGGNRGSYRLGPAAYALALRTPSINELVDTYRPALIEVTAHTQLSSYLMLRSGLDTICVDQQVGEIFAQPYVSGIGGRIPLGVGVSGVVLLAMMENRSRDRACDMLTGKWAEWGITRDSIEAEIVNFCATGFLCGIRRSHGIESLTLTLPILNNKWSGLAGALSVLAPLNLLDDKAQAETLEIMKQALANAQAADEKMKRI